MSIIAEIEKEKQKNAIQVEHFAICSTSSSSVITENWMTFYTSQEQAIAELQGRIKQINS